MSARDPRLEEEARQLAASARTQIEAAQAALARLRLAQDPWTPRPTGLAPFGMGTSPLAPIIKDATARSTALWFEALTTMQRARGQGDPESLLLTIEVADHLAAFEEPKRGEQTRVSARHLLNRSRVDPNDLRLRLARVSLDLASGKSDALPEAERLLDEIPDREALDLGFRMARVDGWPREDGTEPAYLARRLEVVLDPTVQALGRGRRLTDLIRAQDIDRARRVADQLVTHLTGPARGAIHREWGEALLAAGQIEEAAHALRSACQDLDAVTPDTAPPIWWAHRQRARLVRARILALQGDEDEHLEAQSQALEILLEELPRRSEPIQEAAARLADRLGAGRLIRAVAVLEQVGHPDQVRWLLRDLETRSMTAPANQIVEEWIELRSRAAPLLDPMDRDYKRILWRGHELLRAVGRREESERFLSECCRDDDDGLRPR